MKTLAQLMCELPGARVVGDAAHAGVLRVHTDTRSLRAGDLFVALRGERFDAHDFLPQVAAAGAVAAIGEQGLSGAGLCGVEVPDSRAALGQLAAAWRAQSRLCAVMTKRVAFIGNASAKVSSMTTPLRFMRRSR